MTPRFKLALTGLLAMALAAGAVFFFFGGQGSDDTLDALDGGDELVSGNGNGGTLMAGTDVERTGGTDAGVRALPGGGVPLSSREPFGADYSDPAFRTKKLAELLEAPVVKWNEIRRLLLIEDQPLSDTAKARLIDAVREGGGLRGLVLQAISVVRDPTFAVSLFNYFDEPGVSAAERQTALLALAAMPLADKDEVARQLETRLVGNFAKDVRVLGALAARGGRESARALVEYLQRNANGSVRADAFSRVNLKDDPEAREIFEAALRKEKSPEVTTQLLTLIGKPGSGDLVDAVRAVESGEASMAVRKAALGALSRIGTADAIIHLLVRARESGVMGEAALRSIDSVTSADLEAREALRKELERAGLNSRPTQAKSKLLRALGRLKDKDSLPAMVEALDDADEAVGRAAIMSIGQLGEHAKPAFKRLVNQYADANTGTRRALVNAMVGIGNPDALTHLQKWSQEEGLPPSLSHQIRIAMQSVQSRIDRQRR